VQSQEEGTIDKRFILLWSRTAELEKPKQSNMNSGTKRLWFLLVTGGFSLIGAALLVFAGGEKPPANLATATREQSAIDRKLEGDIVQVEETTVSPPTRSEVRVEDNPAADVSPQRRLLVGTDAALLVAVNNVLSEGHLPAINGKELSEADLPVFRDIVTRHNAACSQAESNWLSRAVAATGPLEKDVLRSIDAGRLVGLPLMSDTNPMERREPYEAISQLSYGGRIYVLRVSPRKDPELARLGTAVETAQSARRIDFDSLVRLLFSSQGGGK